MLELDPPYRNETVECPYCKGSICTTCLGEGHRGTSSFVSMNITQALHHIWRGHNDICFFLTDSAFFDWPFKGKHVPRSRPCWRLRTRQPFIAWPRQRNGRSALIASRGWSESLVRVLFPFCFFFLLRLRFCSFGPKLSVTLPLHFFFRNKIGCNHMKCRCRQEYCHRCNGVWPCRKGCA